MKLAELLKDSSYRLSQFKPSQIAALEAGITQKDTGKTTSLYVNCLVRNKPIKLIPEEAVRQLYVMVLRDDLGYPMVASTEYVVLRQREEALLSVEALLVYLRSPLPQLVFKWSQDGSNHPRFDEKELLRMPVPRVLIDHSAHYVKAMQNLKTAKQRAARLLDAVKRSVKIAIEQDEAAGMAYLAREGASK